MGREPTRDPTLNNVGQGSTGALPPDQLSLILHALGPFLGVQHPLAGLQEDAPPEVQHTVSVPPVVSHNDSGQELGTPPAGNGWGQPWMG